MPRRLLTVLLLTAVTSCSGTGGAVDLDVRSGNEGRESFFGVAATEDGELMVAGVRGAGGGDQELPAWDGVLAGFGADGKELFNKVLSSPGFDQFNDVVVLGDGTVVFAGAYSGAFEMDGVRVPHTGAGTDGILLALDQDGRMLWYRTFSGGESEFEYKMATTGSGVLVATHGATGPLETDDGAGAETLEAEPGIPQAHLVEVSGSNEVLRAGVVALDGAVYDIEATSTGWIVAGVFDGGLRAGELRLRSDQDGGDGFILGLDRNLSPTWARNVTGRGETPISTVVRLSEDGSTFAVAGHFTSTVTTGRVRIEVPDVDRAAFVLMFEGGEADTALTLTAPRWVSPYALARTGENSFVLVGEFQDSVALDTDPERRIHAAGKVDGYVLEVDEGGAPVLLASGQDGFDSFDAVVVHHGEVICAGSVGGADTETETNAHNGDGWIHRNCTGRRPVR